MAVSAQTYERDIWELNTQIALIRFSFRHLSRHPHIRAEFINERAEQTLNGWRQFAQTKPEEFCGYENVLPTFAKKETDWLRDNLEAVIEFSEHRLNQMELIVRYALFEAVLTDVVGNILWEYPHLIQDSIHSSFEPPKQQRVGEDAADFRGRRTEEIVNSVDKLRYQPPSENSDTKKGTPKRPACLNEYLKSGLGLQFEQETFADILEKVRKARNNIAHRSKVSPQTLTDEFMARARFALSEFPRRSIVAAAQEYPEACTTERSDGQSERPGYVIQKLLKGI